MARILESLIGKRFGRLVVIDRFVGVTKGGKRKWHCWCDCGGTTDATTSNLKRGNTSSCGCLQKERAKAGSLKNIIHGKSYNAEYIVWNGMIQRCTNPEAVNFSRYGGRGITVCDRWRDVNNFIADMGPRPSPNHTLERIRNNEGYNPRNCRWATKSEQARNRRNTTLLAFRGRTSSIAEWAEITGINQKAISRRRQLGWSIEKTLTTPIYGNA